MLAHSPVASLFFTRLLSFNIFFLTLIYDQSQEFSIHVMIRVQCQMDHMLHFYRTMLTAGYRLVPFKCIHLTSSQKPAVCRTFITRGALCHTYCSRLYMLQTYTCRLKGQAVNRENIRRVADASYKPFTSSLHQSPLLHSQRFHIFLLHLI